MKKKIFIIDDEIDFVTTLCTQLQLEGYDTIYATDAISAITLASTENPDIILLDIIMPGMNGIQLCKTLKTIVTTSSTPIIILTGSKSKNDIINSLSAGAIDYIVKPFEFNNLLNRINNAITKYRNIPISQKIALLPFYLTVIQKTKQQLIFKISGKMTRTYADEFFTNMNAIINIGKNNIVIDFEELKEIDIYSAIEFQQLKQKLEKLSLNLSALNLSTQKYSPLVARRLVSTFGKTVSANKDIDIKEKIENIFKERTSKEKKSAINVTIKKETDWIYSFVLSGILAEVSFNNLKESIESLVAGNKKIGIIFDMDNLKEINYWGMSEFLRYLKEIVKDKNFKVRFLVTKPDIKHILNEHRVSRIASIFSSITEAKNSLLSAE